MLTFIGVHTFANNLQISNISATGKDTVVDCINIRFDVSWENSWRLTYGAANWDAAWIFIKYKTGDGVWQHATLSTKSSFHIAPTSCTIDAVNDGKGVFIYKDSEGAGNNNWQDIELVWNYGEDAVNDNETGIEIKVFGIEMVYILQGGYYLGDGVSNYARLWNAALYPDINPVFVDADPVVVRCSDFSEDDEQIVNTGILIDGRHGIDIDGISQVDNPDYPTGYNSFYCMKYELSNQQYAEFLNTLTRKQQNTRTFIDISEGVINYSYVMNRHYDDAPYYRNSVRYKITGGTTDPVVFFCDLNMNGIMNEPDDGQNIAFSTSGWGDLAAYADWSGLRPMTELEFEKACRGPEYPVVGEFAWHTARINTEEYRLNNGGTATEYPQNPETADSANAAYRHTTGHDTQIETPLRCGIFATATSNKALSGGSFYGVFELSGNLNERTVTIGKLEGRMFKGSHGDGNLSVTDGYEGNATNTDWPGISNEDQSQGVTGRNGTGSRGGDWNDSYYFSNVSQRIFASYKPYGRNVGSGIRCVRSTDN